MDGGGKRRKLSNGSYEAVKPGKATEGIVGAKESLEKKDHRRSLFIRSLPTSVTTQRLAEYFSQLYPLKHATVVVDPKTKLSKGYGFVTFTDAEDAHAALLEYDGSTLDGRKIKVEIAEPRLREMAQEDGSGGGKSGPNTKAAELRAEREAKRAEAQQPPKLIVRNLPWSIKEPEDLAVLFRSYGKIKHAVVPKRSPRVQAGFGFVVIRGRKNAEKAIEGVNGKEVDGRTLAVDWAVDKKTWEALQHGSQADDDEEKEESIVNGQDEAVEDVLGPSASDEPEEASNSATGESESELSLETEGHDDIHEPTDERQNTTIFIRNLPFNTTDELLQSHFASFGPVRYARVVYDPETERSKGTGFVCFFNEADAKSCVKSAPKHEGPAQPGTDKKRRGEAMAHSILENEALDPSGRYTLDGRVLQVSRALNKADAARRADEASSKRDVRDRDKRRLYLLSEGTISSSSKLYSQLGKAEIDIRESSARQRQKLIKSNPNLCLSLTRLSVRNIPRSIDSKQLKALAREAVVGFASDVKAGLRQPLSKEELARGGEQREVERARKEKGVGIVRQAKIVFEGREGGRVKEDSGAGRSRGYGFIEYVSHRNALMGLRWLNGHAVKSGSDGERSKRLIVEFAIENAQVVQRRAEREKKAWKIRNTGTGKTGGAGDARESNKNKQKRKREGKPTAAATATATVVGKSGAKAVKSAAAPDMSEPEHTLDQTDRNRLAKRNRIISKKRHMRKVRGARGRGK